MKYAVCEWKKKKKIKEKINNEKIIRGALFIFTNL